jgi:hypothetical protein
MRAAAGAGFAAVSAFVTAARGVPSRAALPSRASAGDAMTSDRNAPNAIGLDI